MPSNIVELERQAVLLAVTNLVKQNDTNVTALANDIMAVAEQYKDTLPNEMGLNSSETDRFHLQVEAKQNKAMRATLDRLAKEIGEEPRNEKQAMLIFYARQDQRLQVLTKEAHDELRIEADYPEVAILQRHFNDHGSGQLDFVKAMHGDYVLYRPYYFDADNQVMRLRLTIGAEDNPFDARLYHKYDATKFHRGPEEYTRSGLAVPLPQRDRAVISLNASTSTKRKSLDTKQGSQILYIDFISAYSEHMQIMTGVALSAIGSSPASAWPFYIHRLDENDFFEPDVVPRDHPSILPRIEQKLKLGAVKWEDIY